MNQPTHQLDQRFEEFLQTASLVKNGDSIVLAVSGGIDSMAMLYLFDGLRAKWNLQLHIAHTNHQLRGEESIGDEQSVRSVAETLRIPFFCKRVDTIQYAHTKNLSKQEAARDLRYVFFEEVRQKTLSLAVATAHQADDNAETVLLNALRGTGVRGLAGIPVRRVEGNVIRPLLFARRSDIEEYVHDRAISFRNDSSNNSLEYKRNYLRKTVIPLLTSEIHLDVVGSLNRVSQVMRQLDERIRAEVTNRRDRFIHHDEQGRTILAIPLLLAEPMFLQEEIILEMLRMLHVELRAEKVSAILALCTQPTGHWLQLSRSVTVYRDRERLVFGKPPESSEFQHAVSIGGTYSFPSFRFAVSAMMPPPKAFKHTKSVEFVDAERLGSHLLLRSWKEGDWFMPLGMQGKKKVSDFFADEKVPLFEKSAIPILESEGTIVWICGKRLDDRFKITEQTRSVVQLHYIPTIQSL